MTRRLRISDDLTLPLEAVTEPMGMLAARRAGKSNAAVVLAEEMFDAGLHWVAIDPKGDWWGIRSDAEGKPGGLQVPILGGAHGDIPLEPGAGAYIADLIVDEHLTCLLDVSGFASEAEKIRFLLGFGDRLFRRKEQGQEPTHVFFEEADDYVPQRAFPEQARLVHVMSRILKQGGSRGLGGTVISQRSAVVHKDILSQIQTLFALRTTSPQDRKAIKGWVSFSGENPEVVESLHELADGEAWVWSPNWLKTTQRIRFRRRRTFDSGATPKVGATKRPPATLADVDLGALQQRMAETIERAKADDPRELRRRIVELERRLKAAPTDGPAGGEAQELERQLRLLGEAVPALRDQVEHSSAQLIVARDSLQDAAARLRAVAEELDSASMAMPQGDPTVKGPAVRVGVAAPYTAYVQAGKRPADVARPTPARPDTPAAPPAIGGDLQLDAGARRMLEALAQLHPTPLKRSQLGTLANVSWKSGTFRSYLSKLRISGLIEEPDKDTVALSAAGANMMASQLGSGAPSVGDLVEMWNRKLDAGARRMLALLVELYPDGLTRAELGERTEVSYTSGTFRSYLSKLRVNRLIAEEGGLVRAGEALFIGGGR